MRSGLTSSHMAFPAAARTAGAPSDLAWPLGALALGAAAMGLSPVLVRWSAAEVGPVASAFWRVLLALPALWAWTRAEEMTAARRAPGPAAPGQGGAAAVAAAGIAFAGDLVFWHLAIGATTVANATFFATTAPVFVLAIGWFALRRRPAPATLGGLLLCLAGGAALIGQSARVDPARLSGDACGIVTAAFFATYMLCVERARASSGPGRVTFGLTGVAAAILLPIALAADPGRFWPPTAETWAVLGALGIVSHAGGQGLLSVALGRLPVGFSSLVIFLEAIVAAVAGILLLGEAVVPVQLAGGVLIVAGIWVARPKPAGPAAAEPAA